MFKLIKSLLPWYLRPDYLMEIIPEIIKDNSTAETKTKPNKFKMGLNEIAYGIIILILLYIIRYYINF